ncbi:MAG: 4-hydroxy-tetrahydrodipicolinate reductase [Firmicutes bacterium]|nr:4-hydroxy-tetrahydrodipicolinate reductase [Bacillota bacterium]
MDAIKVAVCGASGNMGREAIRAISEQNTLRLVGALDIRDSGKDVGLLIGSRPLGIEISLDLEPMLQASGAEVMVDFTAPAAVMEHIFTALKNGVTPVVGTTGLTDPDLEQVASWVDRFETGAIIAPNFAMGAILMMKFSRIAARYFDQVEIIELHHEHKIDAPSGTAIKTAQMITAERKEEGSLPGRTTAGRPEEIEKISGARGGRYENIHIHSIRLPGMVAHQEVIFGGNGQTLSIRHDSMDRRSFMPGLLMAIDRAPRLKKLIYGMENLIDF